MAQYGPPNVDFSALGDIGTEYRKGQEYQTKSQFEDALKAAAKTPGPVNFDALVKNAMSAGYTPGIEMMAKLKQAEAANQFHRDQLNATIEHQRAIEGKPQIFGNPDVGYFDANAGRSVPPRPGAGPAPAPVGGSMYEGLPGWKPGERPIAAGPAPAPGPAVAAGPAPAPTEAPPPPPALGAGVRQLVPPRETDFSPTALDLAARRIVNGDAGGLTGLGRGAQGDKRLLAVQNRAAEILTTERNMQPEEAASYLGAQLQKFKAAQINQNAWARVEGQREGNLNLILKATDAAIPAALELSDQVSRTGFVPLNKIIQKGQVMVSDPTLRRFGMANLQLAEHWARAMNPTGVMRESDRDLALGFLSTADSNDTYKQVVQQLRLQIDREKAAIRGGHTVVAIPGATREIPKDAINDLIANPGTAAKFDEWFGPGQSQRILGSLGPR